MIRRASDAHHFGEITRVWEAVVTEWTGHILSDVGPRTAARYLTSLEMVKPFLGGKNIAEIGKADIDQIVTGRRSAGATNATIKRDLTAVSSVLRFAQAKDWCDRNPALDRTGLIRERRDPIVLPTEGSIRYLLGRCDPYWRALILSARYTGARLDELRNLLRADFDPKRKTLYIRKAKRAKPRTVDLTADALASLSSVPPSLATKHLLHNAGEAFGYISTGFRSKVHWAHKAAQRDGVEFEPFTFHSLRHLYAVETLKSGVSLYDLQQQMGHSSIKQTEAYCRFLSPEEAKQAKGLTARNTAQA